jgi:lysozyme
MSLVGIDVSDYQGIVDWNAVAQSGRTFAFAKATEGTNFVCRTFARNWAGMQAAGLVRGAYHFARPDSNSPQAEAAFFLQQVEQAGGLAPGDLLVLDLEAGSGNLLGWAQAWLQYVYDQVGVRPLLYSGAWFLMPHSCCGDDFLGQHGLWLAAYQAEMPGPPPGWPVIAFWQHTDRAIVPGVPGPCDQSYFNGDDIEQLKLYGMPGDGAAAEAAAPAEAAQVGDPGAEQPGDTGAAAPAEAEAAPPEAAAEAAPAETAPAPMEACHEAAPATDAMPAGVGTKRRAAPRRRPTTTKAAVKANGSAKAAGSTAKTSGAGTKGAGSGARRATAKR